jgi:hypothetical protein
VVLMGIDDSDLHHGLPWTRLCIWRHWHRRLGTSPKVSPPHCSMSLCFLFDLLPTECAFCVTWMNFYLWHVSSHNPHFCDLFPVLWFEHKTSCMLGKSFTSKPHFFFLSSFLSSFLPSFLPSFIFFLLN